MAAQVEIPIQGRFLIHKAFAKSHHAVQPCNHKIICKRKVDIIPPHKEGKRISANMGYGKGKEPPPAVQLGRPDQGSLLFHQKKCPKVAQIGAMKLRIAFMVKDSAIFGHQGAFGCVNQGSGDGCPVIFGKG